MIRSAVSVLPALLLFGAGCAHKQSPPVAKTEAPPATTQTQSETSGPAQKTCATDLDCGDKQLCINARCVDITPELAECTSVRVHFPFNSDSIDPSDRPQLDRSARCLKADHSLHVTVEGNADERGTEEYNMALGDRRAHAVVKYLEALGASQQQLQTVSFGKENPECKQHDEECWSKNRRAALKASAKSHK